MTGEAICKGSWQFGTACGRCERCIEEARSLIPKLMERERAMHELLEGIQDELKEHRRLVSNPLLTARAIASVIGD